MHLFFPMDISLKMKTVDDECVQLLLKPHGDGLQDGNLAIVHHTCATIMQQLFQNAKTYMIKQWHRIV
jgi:hypothetical protein